ncbi:MAG: mechanosensitive ion channel family protein [Flavobacteriaceae bacterium]|nr:mechanosensitive ion channel family protein [Flavobacteriaceae bacterium]
MEKTANIDLDKILNFLSEKAILYIPKMLLGIVILWIGFKLIRKILVFTDRGLEKVFDDTVRPFLNSTIGFLLKGVLLMIVAKIIGFDLAGLLGIFAAMAFAVGMALQGSLGNFASGILILVLKPYRVEDWIQLDDKFGQVEVIGLFNTVIVTPGSKTLIIPNSKITDGVVTNYSKKELVRLEIGVTMPYSESFPKVKKIIEQAIQNVENVVSEPIPEIGIENFDSHSIDVIVRPYTRPENFWQVTFDTHQAIKKAFSENNVQVAYSEGVEMGSIGE